MNGYVARKNHPLPAPVFVIVGKYINVPEHLYGPLKYASPTINIEQIVIPKKHNLYYEKTGKKKVSLVTGSCASITISAITVKFCEDMIERYKNMNPLPRNINNICREEYGGVARAYWQGRLEELKDYCEEDIKATANVLLKFSNLNTITEKVEINKIWKQPH